MTTEQRELAEAGAGMLVCRDHGMEAAAIRAALTDLDALSAEVALLRRVVTLTNADDPYCVDCQEGSCGAYREWRERFGQEAGR